MRAHTPGRFIGRNDKILPGIRRTVPVAQPAAGTEWSVNVPGGRQWRFLGGAARLQTSAVVANRFPTIQVTVGGVIVFLRSSGDSIPATTNSWVNFVPGGFDNVTSPHAIAVRVAVPDFWIPDGSAVTSATVGLDVGDQWGVITPYVEEIWVTDQELTFAEDELERYALAIEQATEQATAGAAGGV